MRSREPTAGSLRAAAAMALVALACGGAREPDVVLPDVGRGDCRVAGPGPADRARADGGGDTIRISAPGPLEGADPPGPASLAERIAYRHLYATLVRVDCRGRVEPGWASSWRRDEGGRRWTFELRAGTDPAGRRGARPARRPDVVLNAWRRSGLLSGAAPGAGTPASAALYAARTGERRLSVWLPRAESAPALFADPRFAVTGLVSSNGLPAATGSHRLRSVSGGPGARIWVLIPRDPRRPVLRVAGHRSGRRGPGPSARDLIDRGADLVVTRLPAPRRYATSLPEYGAEPLPWDRTYVLVVPELAGGGPTADTAAAASPRGADPAPAPPPGDPGPDGAVLRDLARDAVRADARPARAPHWWQSPCGNVPTAEQGRHAGTPGAAGAARPARERAGSPASSRRLVYRAGDATAAELASRLAALSRRGRAGREAGTLASALRAARGEADGLRAAPVPPARVDSLLRDGAEAGYVLPLPRRTLAACRARAELVAGAAWLSDAFSSGAVVPLVDTRPHLVVRRGVRGVRIDWDGIPRLDPDARGRSTGSP